MSDKTFVFDSSAGSNGMLGLLAPMFQQRGLDPNLLLAMNNKSCSNGWGGEGGWFIWILFLLLFGWGNNGWGGGFGGNRGCCANEGFLASQIGNDFGRDLLLQAINGNGTAISQLASTLNCDINQIQQSINNLNTQILSVSNQVGMSSQQIINAINAGNCQLASQLSSCCCDLKNMVTAQGYENRIATLTQTNEIKDDLGDKFTALTAKIDAQTQIINDNFSGLEKRELQREINQLRDEKNALQASALSQTQTANIVNAVRPCPTPSYIVCNPYASNGYGYPYGGYGYPYGFEGGNGCC